MINENDPTVDVGGKYGRTAERPFEMSVNCEYMSHVGAYGHYILHILSEKR